MSNLAVTFHKVQLRLAGEIPTIFTEPELKELLFRFAAQLIAGRYVD